MKTEASARAILLAAAAAAAAADGKELGRAHLQTVAYRVSAAFKSRLPPDFNSELHKRDPTVALQRSAQRCELHSAVDAKEASGALRTRLRPHGLFRCQLQVSQLSSRLASARTVAGADDFSDGKTRRMDVIMIKVVSLVIVAGLLLLAATVVTAHNQCGVEVPANTPGCTPLWHSHEFKDGSYEPRPDVEHPECQNTLLRVVYPYDSHGDSPEDDTREEHGRFEPECGQFINRRPGGIDSDDMTFQRHGEMTFRGQVGLMIHGIFLFARHTCLFLPEDIEVTSVAGLTSGMQCQRRGHRLWYDKAILDRGYQNDVDIWGNVVHAHVCFSGTGYIGFLDAAFSPRPLSWPETHKHGDNTCVNIYTAGNAVFVERGE